MNYDNIPRELTSKLITANDGLYRMVLFAAMINLILAIIVSRNKENNRYVNFINVMLAVAALLFGLIAS